MFVVIPYLGSAPFLPLGISVVRSRRVETCSAPTSAFSLVLLCPFDFSRLCLLLQIFNFSILLLNLSVDLFLLFVDGLSDHRLVLVCHQMRYVHQVLKVRLAAFSNRSLILESDSSRLIRVVWLSEHLADIEQVLLQLSLIVDGVIAVEYFPGSVPPAQVDSVVPSSTHFTVASPHCHRILAIC